MGFLDNIISATVKTVVTPIVVVKDIANAATGEKIKDTGKHVESIIKDLEKATGLD
jgi:hypothetical protein